MERNQHNVGTKFNHPSVIFWSLGNETCYSKNFDDEHGLYGAKRIAASLKADTDFPPINHKKVARIMKSMGLKGFTKRRRCD